MKHRALFLSSYLPLLFWLFLLCGGAIVATRAAFGKEQPRGTPSLLVNPSFEEELKGWENADSLAMAGAFSLDTEIKRTGKAALHVKPQTGEQWPWICQHVSPIEPGAEYIIGVWHWGGSGGTETFVAVRLEFLDAEKRPLSTRMARQLAQPQQWQYLAVGGIAPAGAVTAIVYLRVMGQGEIWLDDVEFVRSKPAPQLTIRPERLVFVAGEQPTVTLQVVSADEWAEKTNASVMLVDARGKIIKGVGGELRRSNTHSFIGEFALPALPPGAYVWQAKAGELKAQASLFIVPRERRPKSFDERGVIRLENGDPFFPIGIYHVSVADYPQLVEQGFNMAQGPGTHAVAALRAALQEAQKHKLRLQIPLHIGGLVQAHLKASEEKITFCRKNPGALEFKLADEPETHPEIADEIARAYLALRQKNDLFPILLTIADPAAAGYWAHFCDSMQIVGLSRPEEPLERLAERVRRARAALQPWQHLSVVLPAGYRAGAIVQPTYGQARLMAYVAVIAGAKGLWWYAFRAPGFRLTETELWAKFRRLNEECAALGAAAISGPELAIASDNKNILAAAWRNGDKIRLAVVNVEQEAQAAVLKFDGVRGNIEIEHGNAQAEIKEEGLHVSLPPQEAALLLITPAK